VPDDPPALGLEEQLGALGVVDPLVGVRVRRLQLARLAASQVGHPAGPDLVRGLDRREERVFGDLTRRKIFERTADVRGRYLQDPVQREPFREVASVQRPAGTRGGSVTG
jgi:hypothetical protein